MSRLGDDHQGRVKIRRTYIALSSQLFGIFSYAVSPGWTTCQGWQIRRKIIRDVFLTNHNQPPSQFIERLDMRSPRMEEGRITHDYMDIGGRAKQDARAEEQLSRCPDWVTIIRDVLKILSIRRTYIAYITTYWDYELITEIKTDWLSFYYKGRHVVGEFY